MFLGRPPMSVEEVSKAFPTGAQQDLDANTLQDLLPKAILAYHGLAQKMPVSYNERILVCRPTGEGTGFRESQMVYPRCLGFWEPAIGREALSQSGIRELLDYLWARGNPKRSFHGPDPQREAWELRLLHDLIHEPLVRVVDDAAIDEAVDTGAITPGRLPAEKLALLTGEIAQRLVERKHTFVATCPLFPIEAIGEAWEIGEGITLRMPNHQERLRYRSRHSAHILDHDSISKLGWRWVGLLEIRDHFDLRRLRQENCERLPNDLIARQVADAVDVCKWALAACTNPGYPLSEGTIICQDILGGKPFLGGPAAFKRQESSGGMQARLDDDTMREVQALFRDAQEFRRCNADLSQAFWFWGRACVAVLERDIMLEAIFGLERLVNGNQRYRFQRYGATLLSSGAEIDLKIEKDLRKLYEARGREVHHGVDISSCDGRLAMGYLTKAILRTIQLIREGELDPKKNIPRQIKKLAPRHGQAPPAES